MTHTPADRADALATESAAYRRLILARAAVRRAVAALIEEEYTQRWRGPQTAPAAARAAAAATAAAVAAIVADARRELYDTTQPD